MQPIGRGAFVMFRAGWGGRPGTSIFGSSLASQPSTESFRHFSGGGKLRVGFR